MRPRTDRHTDARDHNTFRVVCDSTRNVTSEKRHPGRRRASRQTDAGAESGVDLFRTWRTTDRHLARVSRSPLSVDVRQFAVY